MIEEDLRSPQRQGVREIVESLGAEPIVCRLLGDLPALAAFGAGLLKRGNDQLDRGSPAVTLDFHGGNRRFEHDSDHLVTERITNSAQP